jgi:folate-binding protein YgfZ
MPIALCPTECVSIAGADAIAFAHAQFSSDVKSLATGAWQWSAWLDPQGRVRFFFALLHGAPSTLIAWLPLGGASSMREALARFVMRARVTVDLLVDWHLHALDASESIGDFDTAQQVINRDAGFTFALPGATERIAWLAPGATSPDSNETLNQWRRADIACGLPWLAPESSGQFAPQALDLERLDAIRFDKGCYPGQEIAARLHFRGGNKRHLRRLRIDGPAPLPATPVVDEAGSPIGQILYSAVLADNASVALGVLAWPRGEALQALVDGVAVRTDDQEDPGQVS